ncbi:hypothetical protein ERO13_D06G175308v2 [Gossypium hirsutum]|uniref:Plant thionin family protein n=2 Tax=Gossypium TaxID=3633 RepID=A0A5D2KML4_GOSTO|nr:hypothetical protein ERO13_D06G175308v2 [Gossypium hirsutum]TYG65838.1 hypothetical protein ES288_D06G219100v1 [Gossypium darwinii]TYH67925.1 hypothetical protein ES332_D06G223200v1 [Gossypium tomentosum]
MVTKKTIYLVVLMILGLIVIAQSDCVENCYPKCVEDVREKEGCKHACQRFCSEYDGMF